MKISGDTSLSPDALIGAVLTNNNGAQFYLLGLEVNLAAHEISALLRPCDGGGTVGVSWASLADWEIALQSPHYMK
jgi:hypothetical protein